MPPFFKAKYIEIPNSAGIPLEISESSYLQNYPEMAPTENTKRGREYKYLSGEIARLSDLKKS